MTNTDSNSSGLLKSLFAPSSVAIVGDSPDAPTPERRAWGWKVHSNLKAIGYEGEIYSVNRRYDTIDGRPCYPTVSDVPGDVECVVVAVNAAQNAEVLEDAGKAGVKGAVLLANGFAEGSEEGAKRQEDVKRIAAKYDINLVGPNCMGMVSVVDKFAPYPSTLPIPPDYDLGELKDIALVFQSGAISLSVTQHIQRRGLRLSHVVTCGNEANTTLADYVMHIVHSGPPRVVLCFVEQIRDPEGFALAAEAARAAGSAIVMLRSGRSELAKVTTKSHTGSLTGNDLVIDEFLRSLGVIQVRDIDELIETAQLLRVPKTLTSGNIAVMCASGGAAGLLADIGESVGLKIEQYGDELMARMKSVLPAEASINNPLDTGSTPVIGRQLYGADLDSQTYLTDVFTTLLEAPEVAAVLLVLQETEGTTEQALDVYRKMASVAGRCAPTSTKPIVISTISSGAYDIEYTKIAAPAGVAPLHGMRETLRALHLVQSRAADLAAADSEPPATTSVQSPVVTTEESLADALAGFADVVPFEYVDSAGSAVAAAERIGFPVVVKIAHPEVLHKSDIGGVFLGVESAEEVTKAWESIVALFGQVESATTHTPRALVQKMDKGIAELLVGVVQEPGYPPAVVVGTGGVFAEVFRDVAIGLAPVSKTKAGAMIESLQAYPILAGARGTTKADVDAAAEMVVAISQLAWALRGQYRSIEFNPVLLRESGRGATIVDWLIERD